MRTHIEREFAERDVADWSDGSAGGSGGGFDHSYCFDSGRDGGGGSNCWISQPLEAAAAALEAEWEAEKERTLEGGV